MARTIRGKSARREPVGGKVIGRGVARKKTLSVKTPAIKQLPVQKKIRLRRHIEKEIKYYRSVITHLVPKATFIRLLKSIVNKMRSQLRFTKEAIQMLQDAYESYIASTLEASYIATLHAKRVTLKAVDLAVIKKIRERGLF